MENKEVEVLRKKGKMWILVPIISFVVVLIVFPIVMIAGPAEQIKAGMSVIVGLVGILSVIGMMIGFIVGPYYYGKARVTSLKKKDERSGKGPASELPTEVRGWSWGAAFLNVMWGAYNQTWLSLLSFVPYLNMIWWIVMGVKGREWAWRNVEWESVDEFYAAQKKWDKWGIIAFVLSLVSIVLALAIPLMLVSMFASFDSSTLEGFEYDGTVDYDFNIDSVETGDVNVKGSIQLGE